MSNKYLHIGEDNIVEWEALTNQATSQLVEDATLTFSVKDAAGAIVNELENEAMAYTGADGTYQGTIDAADADFTPGTLYYLEITATGSIDGFRRVPCVAKYHEAT